VRNLDLLALLSLSVSLWFFNRGDVLTAAPLAYPPLAYLLARMLWIGFSRRGAATRARQPLKLLVPVSWLAIAAVFLLGFRIGLNLTDSNVIDVGYAGVIGADHIVAGEPIYGAFPDDNQHGDTYGPVTYLAYVPFEQLMPWSGRWDDLPAAHGAALTFDLACVVLLFLLGRRIRGPGMGVVLAYAWLAFPFTLFVANTNSNDALLAALVLGVLLAATSAKGRGILLALAGLTKFAPLALVPLFAREPVPARARTRWPQTVMFAIAFTVTAAIASILIFLHGGTVKAFWDATLGYQADRDSPFSIYGLWGGLGGLRVAVEAGAVLLALGAAVLPRRRDMVGLAALSAAILLALQLSLTYWFFLYLAWVFPLVMIALLCREGEPAS
jgi:hypothetical protein